MRMRFFDGSSLLVLAGVTAAMSPCAANAQSTDTIAQSTTTSEPDAPADGEIVVTARRKAENILTTPIAITAITAADLAKKNIVSLQDITNFTPGISLLGQATEGGRSDRSFLAIVLRGFNPPSSAAQTTSVFIDGVPVSSATAIQSVADPDHIEILKGPQSAYFGRQTFAGAMNVVNKLPSNHLTGSVNGMVGTRSNYDIGASLSAPIFGDVLGFRASVRQYAKDGSYTNAGVAGQTLGDQKTFSATLMLAFKPTDHFVVKAFGLLSKNHDGPSAQGLIPAYTVNDDSGATVLTSQSNCTLTGKTGTGATLTNAFFCGVAPGLPSTAPAQNTQVTQFVRDALANPTGRVVSPGQGVQGYGLVSQYYHLHLTADWTLGDSGFTASSLTGVNHERRSELADFDNYYDTGQFPVYGTPAGGPAYFDFPILIEGKNDDFSQEGRLAFDNGGRFRATVGSSYLNATNVFDSGSLGTLTVNSTFGTSKSHTLGFFFGTGFDITSKLMLNIDGRYQIDKLAVTAAPEGTTITSDVYVKSGFYAGGTTLVSATYKNFMPRAILNYRTGKESIVYASYSKGINPAGFNTGFLGQSGTLQQAAADAGLPIAVKPEKLDNYEIGAKGKLFGNVLRYSLSGYYGIWSDQINSQNILYYDDDGKIQQLVAQTNTGRVRVSGIEGALSATLTPEISLDLGGAITGTYILQAYNSNVTALTGVTNFRGKENAFTSKYSATAGIEYRRALNMWNDASGFIRADAFYKSGQFSDISNVVRSPDIKQVNLRVGVQNKAFSAEVFVTNLFNDKAYYSVADGYTINSTYSYFNAPSALIAALRELRTVGVRTRYSF